MMPCAWCSPDIVTGVQSKVFYFVSSDHGIFNLVHRPCELWCVCYKLKEKKCKQTSCINICWCLLLGQKMTRTPAGICIRKQIQICPRVWCSQMLFFTVISDCSLRSSKQLPPSQAFAVSCPFDSFMALKLIQRCQPLGSVAALLVRLNSSVKLQKKKRKKSSSWKKMDFLCASMQMLRSGDLNALWVFLSERVYADDLLVGEENLSDLLTAAVTLFQGKWHSESITSVMQGGDSSQFL